MFKAKNTALALALMGASSFSMATPQSTDGTIIFSGKVEGECGFHHSHNESTGDLGMTPSGSAGDVWGDKAGEIRYINNQGSTGTLKLLTGSGDFSLLQSNLKFKVEGELAEGAPVDGATTDYWTGTGISLGNPQGSSSHNTISIYATLLDSDTFPANDYSVETVWTVDCN